MPWAPVMVPPLSLIHIFLVGQLNVIGDHHIKDEIGVQRAGGDAEVMDGEGGADLGGQLLSKRPQPLYLRIAHLDGVHMDDRLDVELLVEFPLCLLYTSTVGGQPGQELLH